MSRVMHHPSKPESHLNLPSNAPLRIKLKLNDLLNVFLSAPIVPKCLLNKKR